MSPTGSPSMGIAGFVGQFGEEGGLEATRGVGCRRFDPVVFGASLGPGERGGGVAGGVGQCREADGSKAWAFVGPDAADGEHVRPSGGAGG